MIYRIIRYSFLCVFSLILTPLSAQSEYLAEIGINGGGSYILDDNNGIPFKNSMPAYGIVYRHNFNERFSAHADWNNTKITYTDYLNANAVSTIQLNLIDLCGEFNFFDLVKKQYKPRSKSFSPFIFAGIGAQFTKNSFPADLRKGINDILTIPMGIGFKYKIGNRFNVNAKWAHRISFYDKIEGNEGALNGTNYFNNDVTSTYTLGVSYDFWKRPCDCNDSRQKKNKK